MARMNQRDMAHAYRFLVRRSSLALLHDDPDSPDSPMRKLAIASFGSVMVALLAVAGAGVYGIVRPGGSTAWKSGQDLIVEKETGTRLLYEHGELHPVANYASALLILGQSTVTIVSVSRASLGATPRGGTVGIVGGPDELPTPTKLVTGPWLVCSLPAQDQAGGTSPYVRVSVGSGAPGGTQLRNGRGLLVSAQDGTLYLIWNDQRFLIPTGQAGLAALNYPAGQPVPVGDAWLSAVPQGPDLAAPPLLRIGSAGPRVAGQRTRVGQVLTTGKGGGPTGPGGSGPFYLVEPGGLAPLSVVQADLMLADPIMRTLYPNGRPGAKSVPAAAVAGVRGLQAPAGANELPSRPPPLLNVAPNIAGVCAVYTADGNGSPTIRTLTVPPSAMPTAPPVPLTGPLGAPVANQVRIAGGNGLVAEALGQSPGATVFVITSQGIKYPLTDLSLLSSLGLAGVAPVRVPGAVLSLLRTGPTLDQQAAEHTIAP
jgi:type VII secretion protein EccB